jgi:ribosomal protein L12E/L44/L45/RPP1/RPP2
MATQEPGSIKELRDAADRGKKASQELDAMKREMAFLKAGVDTDTKAGQLLYKAYDGDLETESIQAEWAELAPVAAAPPPEPDATDDARVSQERQNLASDNVPPENQTESPYDAGHRQFQEMIADGRPKDESAARFVHTVLEAAGGADPDQRVISDR